MPDDAPAPTTAPSSSLEGRISFFDELGGSIDSLIEGIKEIPNVAKKAAHYAYYTAKAGLGLAVGVAIAGYPGLILPTFMSLGTYLKNTINKVETKFSEISNELMIGGLLAGFLHYMFSGAEILGKIVTGTYGTIAGTATKAAYGIASILPFVRLNEYLNRAFIKEYEAKSFKEQWKESKWMLALLAPAIGANYALEVAKGVKMGIAGGIALVYGLLKGGKKKKEEKAPAPQAPAGYAPQPAYQPT